MTYEQERGMAVFHLRMEHGLDAEQETAMGLFIAHALGHGDQGNADQILMFASTVEQMERNRTAGWLLRSFHAVRQ